MSENEKSRRSGCLRAFLIAIALFIVLLAAVGLFLWNLSRVEPLPSDAELIANFQNHRSDFERVSQLLDQRHGDLNIDPDKPLPKPANAVEAELLPLLQKLNIRYGIETYRDDVVLMAGAEGKFMAHFRKGYSYRSVPPEDDPVRHTRVASSLDVKPTVTTQSTFYRPIGDGWYLFMIGGD